MIVVMASTVAALSAEGTGAARRTRPGDSPTPRRGLAAGGIGRAAPSRSAPTLPTVVVVSTAPVLAAPASPRPGDRPAGPALRWLRGWAAVAHLVLDLVVAVPCLVLTILLVVAVATVPAFGIGIPILAGVLFGARGMAAFERVRFRAFANVDVVAPSPPADLPAWRRYLLEGRAWRAMAYVAIASVWGLVVGTVMLTATGLALALAALPLYRAALPHDSIDLLGLAAVPAGLWWGAVGLAGLVALPFAASVLVRVEVVVATALLGAGPCRPRARAGPAGRDADPDTRRHRRLGRGANDAGSSGTCTTGRSSASSPSPWTSAWRASGWPVTPRARQQLVDHAHAAAKEAITEMRYVARGIHPPVLTDRGLDAALSALAAGSPVPVHVAVDLPRRPTPTLEAIAYFCVSEALTNVAKHAGAGQAVGRRARARRAAGRHRAGRRPRRRRPRPAAPA